VAGDDNIGTHPRAWGKVDWRKIMGWFGLVSKANYHVNNTLGEFCSSRLYETAGGYTFCPKVGKVLAKLGYTCSPNLVERKMHMKGVALGLLPGCGDIPPLRVVLDRILELCGDASTAVSRKTYIYKMSYKSQPLTNVSYYLDSIYQWTHEMQTEFAAWVSTLQFNDPFDHPLAMHLMRVDSGGPLDFW
jgi:hypothetical protein